MEVVLTRLRDFSCKEASFDDCKSAAMLRERRPVEERCGGDSRSPERTGRLDIESALAWLRRELMEMRSQDQALIRQLMDLHAGIQELKQECAVDEEEEEEEEEEEYEETCWDSGSEAGVSSSSSSYSGEMCFYPSSYSPSTSSSFSYYYCYYPFRPTPPPVGALPKRAFSRRSSMP